MELTNKIAVITGGGGNIGKSIAQKLALKGATVLLCDFDLATAQNAAKEIADQGGVAYASQIDVTNYEAVKALLADIMEKYGAIDILVTAAGGSARGQCNLFANQDIDVIEHNIAVNLFGTINFAHAASKYMVVGNRGGRIIFISSICGIQGGKKVAEYSAAKGGVIALAKSLAMELGEHEITVNCVSPGLIRRPNEDNSSDALTNFLKIPGTVDDISDMTAYLASNKARFITGQNFVVDGGRSLGRKGSD